MKEYIYSFTGRCALRLAPPLSVIPSALDQFSGSWILIQVSLQPSRPSRDTPRVNPVTFGVVAFRTGVLSLFVFLFFVGCCRFWCIRAQCFYLVSCEASAFGMSHSGDSACSSPPRRSNTPSPPLSPLRGSGHVVTHPPSRDDLAAQSGLGVPSSDDGLLASPLSAARAAEPRVEAARLAGVRAHAQQLTRDMRERLAVQPVDSRKLPPRDLSPSRSSPRGSRSSLRGSRSAEFLQQHPSVSRDDDGTAVFSEQPNVSSDAPHGLSVPSGTPSSVGVPGGARGSAASRSNSLADFRVGSIPPFSHRGFHEDPSFARASAHVRGSAPRERRPSASMPPASLGTRTPIAFDEADRQRLARASEQAVARDRRRSSRASRSYDTLPAAFPARRASHATRSSDRVALSGVAESAQPLSSAAVAMPPPDHIPSPPPRLSSADERAATAAALEQVRVAHARVALLSAQLLQMGAAAGATSPFPDGQADALLDLAGKPSPPTTAAAAAAAAPSTASAAASAATPAVPLKTPRDGGAAPVAAPAAAAVGDTAAVSTPELREAAGSKQPSRRVQASSPVPAPSMDMPAQAMAAPAPVAYACPSWRKALVPV